ncbi:MAG TPA: hypothetical protein PKZ99_09980, partial [Azospirillaceae bacterium]|mgnify:FL=1|nr:hypothetical protein [Azospirillaceae bacterium]
MINNHTSPDTIHYVYWCIQRQLFLGRAEPNKAAVVAFARGVASLPARLKASRHADRLLSLGYITDVRGLFRRCAAFLNPPRQGGGGAACALGEGLPVVANGEV